MKWCTSGGTTVGTSGVGIGSGGSRLGDQYFASQAVRVQPPAVRGRPRYQV